MLDCLESCGEVMRFVQQSYFAVDIFNFVENVIVVTSVMSEIH